GEPGRDRNEPHEQHVTESIGAKAGRKPRRQRPGAAQQMIAERAPRHQEYNSCARGRADHGREAADERSEQEATKNREQRAGRRRRAPAPANTTPNKKSAPKTSTAATRWPAMNASIASLCRINVSSDSSRCQPVA